MDRFRSRDVTRSCSGDAYFVHESWPMYDQKKNVMFSFWSETKLEPQSLICQNGMRCSRVLHLQEVRDLQLATSRSIAIPFDELNAAVFRA